MTQYSDANIRLHVHESTIWLSQCDRIVQMADSVFMPARATPHRTIFEKNRAKRSVDDHTNIVKAREKRSLDLAAKPVRERTMRRCDHVRLHVDLD